MRQRQKQLHYCNVGNGLKLYSIPTRRKIIFAIQQLSITRGLFLQIKGSCIPDIQVRLPCVFLLCFLSRIFNPAVEKASRAG
jgi:hypothetical protein